MAQDNLRKRVSDVTYEDVYDGIDSTYQHGTYYTYDIHGNVSTLVQDNPELIPASQRYKRIDYEYDLISGKVNRVIYQPDAPDLFIHQYTYDADNRITKVETSTDDVIYQTDAKYFYYAHGPLARIEYGKNQVQGMDYAYTLQGWIKGVNSTTLKQERDMGQDALNDTSNANQFFAQDALGYTLGYYAGDYKAIDRLKWSSVSNRFEAQTAGAQFEAQRYDLFNGNISHMASTIVERDTVGTGLLDPQTAQPLVNAYKYDQLNRIKTSLSFNNISIPNNLWNASGQAVSNMYENTFAYDANGNITTQNRYDNAGVKFDSLSYRYKRDVSGNLLQNRLYHVNDGKSSGLQADDIDDQGVFVSTLATMNTVNNYRYDEIGNLTADSTEEIDTIKWTVYGKIKEIKRTSGSSKKNLKFDYDAGGNRIAKHVLSSAGSWERSTYYVRDAQGNVMSTYDQTGADSSLSFKLLEEHLYGSSRIGMVNPNREMIGADTTDEFAYDTLNKRQYELSNHLGNVLTVAYDRKVALDTNSDGSVDYYLADLASASDYSPFGAPLSGRGFTLSSYRYGFNGKENDNEVKGEGNQQDYGMRVYDTRLGRFLSVDPMTSSYPCLSPYAYAENDVIRCVDLDGLEKDVKVYYSNAKNAQLAKLDAGDLDWIVAKNIIAYTKWPDNGIFQIYHLKSGSYATYSYTYNGKTYTSTITGIDKAYENAQQQKNAEILRTEKFIEGVKTLGLLFTTEFVMPKVLPAGKSSASMTAKAEVQAVEQATSKATQGILSAEIKSASGIIDATVQEEGAFLSGSFKSVNGHELEFITNKVAEGKTLKLTDIVLYPKGVSGNELKNEFGPRQMTEILNIFKNFAKEKGFTKLEVKFMRAENSSSAKPGKIVTKVFDLK